MIICIVHSAPVRHCRAGPYRRPPERVSSPTWVVGKGLIEIPIIINIIIIITISIIIIIVIIFIIISISSSTIVLLLLLLLLKGL